jgi:hypothetical protein
MPGNPISITHTVGGDNGTRRFQVDILPVEVHPLVECRPEKNTNGSNCSRARSIS